MNKLDLPTATIDRGPAIVASEDDAPARPIDGRYQILERLGAGGMATVHRARDLQKDRDVAIKFMKSDLGGSARRRFFREFNTIAGIDHPCCLAVFDIGETEEAPYFTMELHPGQSVSSVMGKPAEQVAHLLVDLTLAIDYIHSQGIVHRDIKPSNVMVQQVVSDGNPRFHAKLADFGLAKFYHLESSLTGERGLVGTPAYCAPEQIEGRQIDHRADLYSIGMLAYELLSGGYHPFADARGQGINALLHAQLTAVPAPITAYQANVSPALAAIIDQYLAKDAEQRPPSAEALRNSICGAYGITVDEGLKLKSTPDNIQINTFGFVCRKDELLQIDGYLSTSLTLGDDLQGGNPQAALVFTGDPGIGKTSLVEEATRKAMSLGYRVFEGRCFDGDLSSFHPFVAIIRQIFSGLKQTSSNAEQTTMFAADALGLEQQGRIEQILLSYRQELLRIAPELRRWLPGEVQQQTLTGDGQYIVRALSSMFIELSQVRPICICLDDLQWADQSSLTLLKFLATAIASGHNHQAKDSKPPQLAILCTARSGYSALEEFLRREQSQSRIATVELSPFDLSETKLVISLRLGCHAGQVTEELTRSIDVICRGNPFFVSETVRDWRSRDRIVRDRETWTLNQDTVDDSSLPSTVRSALGSRLSELSDAAKQILASAAAIGRVVDLDLLEQVLPDLPENALLDGVDELLSKRVFVETTTASRVEFGHDLLRELVLSETTSNRRRAIHRGIAAALQEKSKHDPSKVPSATLAIHFLAGEQRQQAFQYLLKAAQDAASAGAYENALGYLKSAEEQTQHESLEAYYFDLHSQFCLVETSFKHLGDAEKYARLAIETAPDSLQRGRFLGELAWIKQQSGALDEASKFYDEGLACLGFPRWKTTMGTLASIAVSSICFHILPAFLVHRVKRNATKESAAVICLLLSRYYWVLAPRSMIELTQVAMIECVAGKISTDKCSKALAFTFYAANCSLVGAHLLARRYSRKAKNLIPDDDPSMLYAYAKCKDAAATYLMGDLEKAEEDLLDGINRFKHTKDHFSSLGYHWLRHIYSTIGTPHLILEAAQQELNAAEATGDVEIIGYAHYGICHGMALKGEFETAMQAGDTSVRLLESNQSYFRAIGFMERGFAHLQMSNYRGAREDFKQGIQVLNSMVLHLEILTPLLPRMIEACLGPNWNDGPKAELVDLRTASRYTLRARFFSNVFPNIRPHVLRVMGRYYFVKGKTNKARKYFEASIAAAEKLGARFEHARALDDSGRAFPELAERRIQAREILAELDAVMPVAECVDYHGPVLKTQTESEPTASLPMASPT